MSFSNLDVVFLKVMTKKENHVYTQYIKALLEKQGKTNFSNTLKKLSHDQLTRTMNNEYPWQTLLWNFITALVSIAGGYLVLDDTVILKSYSTVDESLRRFVRYVWSNKDQKVVRGINVVFVLLVVGNLRIPLGFRLYDKSQTKIELALELLSIIRNQYGFSKTTVLFDSWYCCKKIVRRIHAYGWVFVGRIKRSRKVSGVAVKRLIDHPYGNVVGEMNGIRIRLVRHRKHYLVCNRVGLTGKDIREWYAKRSVIEHFFKELKNYFHLNDCQSRSKVAWENHIYGCLLCFLFVEFRSKDDGETLYKTRMNRISRSYRVYINLWEQVSINE